MNPTGILCACGDPEHDPWCGRPFTPACYRTCARFWPYMREDGKETIAAMRQADLDVLEERPSEIPDPKIARDA